MNKDEAFICLNNFYINPEEDKVTCLAKCGNQGENMRIPGTMETKGICSINKSSDLSINALNDYPNNIACSSSANLIDSGLIPNITL